jgi:neurofibromin 1
VEADEIVQEAIDALTDLPNDALAVIAWTLGNILDTLSKVFAPLMGFGFY